MAKQVIIIRKDLNMRKGKMCAMAAHASMGALFSLGYYSSEGTFTIRMTDPVVMDWVMSNYKKICVSCDSEQEMLELYKVAEASGFPFKLIKDSGLTEFHGVPTITALAIGPASEEDIDKITGHLKLL